jgi:dihydrolipoamide dehydrogenase
MLAHAASGQGVIAIENICNRPKTIDYRSIPAAAFTHPEISYVGLTEPQAEVLAQQEGYKVGFCQDLFQGKFQSFSGRRNGRHR